MKKILLLGASGNIGSQVIDILNDNSNFELVGVSVGNNIEKGIHIIEKFDSILYFYSINKINDDVKNKFPNITFFDGDEGLNKLVSQCQFDLMVNALVGFCGLEPTLLALEDNKTVCLANKESLVVGGELIYSLLENNKGKLIPLDSEHVALDKCLNVDGDKVKKLILTASGGAFRNLKRKDLKNVTKDDALKHPTWNMGAKITIDCATMMNKCFEIIEAHYMFRNFCDKINVLLHDESLIHSMVLYKNGIYRAEISNPDMHNAIRYSLVERNEVVTTYCARNYKDFGNYHFRKLNQKRFPLIRYAKKVIAKKGLYGCALNACNEECVNAFLNGQISFLNIEKIIGLIMNDVTKVRYLSYELIKVYDSEIRKKTLDLIRKMR